MTKRRSIVVVLLAVVALAAFAQQTIKVGYSELLPYSYPEYGIVKGAAADYFTTYIAPALHVTVQWVGPNPIPRLLSLLDSGGIDAALIVARNPERAAKYLYADAPFMLFQPALAMLREHPLNQVKTQSDVAGLRVSYGAGLVVSDFMKGAQVTWDNVSSSEWVQDGLAKAAAKRVDAVYDLGVDALRYQASLTYPGRFKFLPLPDTPSGIYTVFAKSDRNAALVRLYNQANAKNVGSLPALIEAYLGGR